MGSEVRSTRDGEKEKERRICICMPHFARLAERELFVPQLLKCSMLEERPPPFSPLPGNCVAVKGGRAYGVFPEHLERGVLEKEARQLGCGVDYFGW